MPYSKSKQAAWMREYRAQKKAAGTALMPKSLVRQLRRLGVSRTRDLRVAGVSLDDYRDLERRLAAKTARVEWQSSGILGLTEKIARLTALLAIQPAMEDSTIQKRLLGMEAEQALHNAEHQAEITAKVETSQFKDLRRFIELHDQRDRQEAR